MAEASSLIHAQCPAAPLRVVLLIDSWMQPAWVCAAVRSILASPAAAIVAVGFKTVPKPARPGQEQTRPSRWQRWRRHWPKLAYYAYARLDARRFKPAHDPFLTRDLRPILGPCPVVELETREGRYVDRIEPDALARLAEQRVDVAVRLGFRILRGDILKLPRFGVWSYHHGDNDAYRGKPAGLWEVLRGDATTGCILQKLNEALDGGTVLYRSVSKTDRRSMVLNKSQMYWKSAAFLRRTLEAVHQDGALEAAPGYEDPTAYKPYAYPLCTIPTNRQMLQGFARLAGTYVQMQVQQRFVREPWGLAIHLGNADDLPDLRRFINLPTPAGSFWADPFAMEKDDGFVVFFEWFENAKRRGHIACVEIDAEGNVGEARSVLREDYHLSYPCVFRDGDTLYMVPETTENRTVDLYICETFPGRWRRHSTLLRDVEAVDPTIFRTQGRWWMFLGQREPHASYNDELCLYWAEDPRGPWQPHPRNPIISDVRRARPGGGVFWHHGRLYRPGQDCSQRYGGALRLHVVEQLSTTLPYREREICTIGPTWDPHIATVHTISRAGRLTVIDGCRKRPRWRS